MMEIELTGDKVVAIAPGQTILDASLKAGIPHFHACGGNARCSTCRIIVLEGMDHLSAVNKKEKKLRKKMLFPENVRLACQTKLEKSFASVHRIIRDETDAHLYTDEDSKFINLKLGEEKELALFFLDIRNFTPFIETYLAFDVIHIIRRLFMIYYQRVEQNKGQIVETTGDGFYAVFGLESSLGEAADSAIKAGYDILEDLVSFNSNYLKNYFSLELQVGIGIHVGRVIAGNINLGTRETLSAMGLAVNVASRLQESTKELNNNFIASEELWRISSKTLKPKMAKVKLKGVSQSVNVRLLGKPYK